MDLISVEISQHHDWTVLRLVGQLDVATAPTARQTLVEAQFGADRVVLDLDGIELLDSFGLAIIVGGLKRARSHGRELVVRCTRRRLLQLFALTRLDEVLTIVTDLRELPGAAQH